MQQTRTHKAVTRRVEAKKLLSRRRQSEYRDHIMANTPSFSLLINKKDGIGNMERKPWSLSGYQIFYLILFCTHIVCNLQISIPSLIVVPSIFLV